MNANYNHLTFFKTYDGVYKPEIGEDEWKILQKDFDFTTSFCEYVNVNNDVTPYRILSVDDICDSHLAGFWISNEISHKNDKLQAGKCNVQGQIQCCQCAYQNITFHPKCILVLNTPHT